MRALPARFLGLLLLLGDPEAMVIEWPHGGSPTRSPAAAQSPSSPRDFLLAHAPGPYTALRTVQHRPALMDRHVERLLQGWRATVADFDVAAAAGDEDALRELRARVAGSVDLALSQVFGDSSSSPEDGKEAMCTVLLEPPNATILVHACTAPPARSPIDPTLQPAVVDVVQGWRAPNPEVKHSSWVRERQQFEAQRLADTTEVLLARPRVAHSSSRRDEDLHDQQYRGLYLHEQELCGGGEGDIDNGDCDLLEGLVTNFCVIMPHPRDPSRDILRTAADGVLGGHVRNVLLDVCEPMGLEVHLEAPRLREAGSWKEAFLTGTGRVLVPVARLRGPDGTVAFEAPIPDMHKVQDEAQQREAATWAARLWPQVMAGLLEKSEPASAPPQIRVNWRGD